MSSEAELVEMIDRQRVDELTSKFSEPNWVRDIRLQAWEAYLQTPMPDSKTEAWRRTDLSGLDLTKLQASNLETARKVEKLPTLPQWYQSAIKHFTDESGVLFQTTKNGGYLKLNEELAAKGVIFCDIATAIDRHPDKIKPYLTRELETDKFTLLTRALFNCGAFLYVPPNVEIEHPFLFGLGFSGNQDTTEYGGAIFPRLIVVAEDNSKVDVVCTLGPESDEATAGPQLSLASVIVDVHAKANSRVSLLEVQELGNDVFLIESLNSRVSRDGYFNSLSVGVGCKQTKADISTYLQAPGAHSAVLGAVLGDGNEHFNFNTVQEHNAPDTRSEINFKVALKDAASSVYQGVIRVAKIAQRTDAYQSNKNLLLGTDARADSIPKLEILANDVKCSHGATVGPVDRDQLFYLRSRGLTENEAEELILLGFFRQVLEQFAMKQATDWLTDVVSRKAFRKTPVKSHETSGVK